MTNTTNPTITLRNAHGAFEVEVDRLNLVILKTKNWSDLLLQVRLGGYTGSTSGEMGDQAAHDFYRDCTRLEAQIILTECGNF